MKFGLWVTANFPADIPAARWYAGLAEQVRVAKAQGFTLISSGQHYLTAPSQRLQTFPLLARLSAEGDGMEVATSVLLLPLHNPVDIAEQAATLDVVTGGRFILGIGMGNVDIEYQAFGIDKKRRVSRYEEALDIMLMLWKGGEVEFQGRHFTVPRTVSVVRCVQQPHVRVWLGGGGEAPLRRAARYGFAWFPGGGQERLQQDRQFYLNALREYGNPVPPDFPMGMWVYVRETEEQALEEAHRYLAPDLSPEEFRQQAARTMVVGTPAQCVERIRQYQALGVTHLLCRLQAGAMPQAEVLRTLRLMGEEVMLKFAG